MHGAGCLGYTQQSFWFFFLWRVIAPAVPNPDTDNNFAIIRFQLEDGDFVFKETISDGLDEKVH